MRGFDQQHEAVIRQLVAWLVAGDFVMIERKCHGIRLSGDDLRRAVSEYGKMLTMPPESAFAAMDVVQVSFAIFPSWSVRLQLQTVEEGRSDLSLECTLIQLAEDCIEVEIDGLLVL